jgi:prephenate dehydrogenase
VINWLEEHAKRLSPHALVIDCSGTKKRICEACFPLAKQYGFTFAGGHPMAGLHQSGFKYSREDLFDGAPMVIVPPAFDDISLMDTIKTMLEPVGFGHISMTTAEEHDRIIAFSSQMAHVISNAYIKSPTASEHQGFSAGSYRDLTRVAWLNPDMWTELFLENREYLLQELDTFLLSMAQYRDALERSDAETMRQLLEDGRQRKRKVDGP